MLPGFLSLWTKRASESNQTQVKDLKEAISTFSFCMSLNLLLVNSRLNEPLPVERRTHSVIQTKSTREEETEQLVLEDYGDQNGLHQPRHRLGSEFEDWFGFCQ